MELTEEQMACFLELTGWMAVINTWKHENRWKAPQGYPDKITFRLWPIQDAYNFAIDMVEKSH